MVVYVGPSLGGRENVGTSLPEMEMGEPSAPLRPPVGGRMQSPIWPGGGDGGRGGTGTGYGLGGGEGGEGGGGGANTRGPQSTQSVPTEQSLNSEPDPPSSQ